METKRYEVSAADDRHSPGCGEGRGRRSRKQMFYDLRLVASDDVGGGRTRADKGRQLRAKKIAVDLLSDYDPPLHLSVTRGLETHEAV